MAQAKAREKPTGVATNAILAWEERSMVTQWIDNWTVKSANICVHLPHSAKSHCKETRARLKIGLGVTMAHIYAACNEGIWQTEGAFHVHLMSKQVPLNYLSECLLHLATLTRGVSTKWIEAVKVGMANQTAPSDISHQLQPMALRPARYFSLASAVRDNQKSFEWRRFFLCTAIWDWQKLCDQLPDLPLWSAQFCIQKGSQDKDTCKDKASGCEPQGMSQNDSKETKGGAYPRLV